MIDLTPDQREERLPKWARDTLNRYRSEIGGLRRALEADPVDASKVSLWADPYSDHPRPIESPYGVIMTAPGAGLENRESTVRVRIVEDYDAEGDLTIEIMGTESLSVRPAATNVVRIDVVSSSTQVQRRKAGL